MEKNVQGTTDSIVCNVIIMKNFNRRNSHVTVAQSAANWRNTHAHEDCTHSLTHFTSTQIQPRGAKRQISYYFSVHAGSVRRVSATGSLTCARDHSFVCVYTGSLTCARDCSCVCVYTRGLGTPTASQHNIFDSEKLFFFLVLVMTS